MAISPKNLRLMIAWQLSCGCSTAFALFPFDDESATPALQALRYKKASAEWSSERFGFFDGLITNDQTESKHYDRRVGFAGGFGFEQQVLPNLGLRLDLKGEAVMRRQLDSAAPETVTDEKYLFARPMADATYITSAGLEIFVGAVWSFFPAYTQKIESAYVSATTKYGSGNLFAPHFGVTRRGGFGSGGFYYVMGRERNRSVTKSASDGTSVEVTSAVSEPTTAAIFAQFSAASALFTTEVAAVSAGEGGQRTDNGNTTADDYLRISLNSVWSNAYRVGLNYQSARYSKSMYMDLDSIPILATQVLWVSGGAGSAAHAGFIYAYGRDRQSIPEVNARYKVDALSVVAGVTNGF